MKTSSLVQNGLTVSAAAATDTWNFRCAGDGWRTLKNTGPALQITVPWAHLISPKKAPGTTSLWKKTSFFGTISSHMRKLGRQHQGTKSFKNSPKRYLNFYS